MMAAVGVDLNVNATYSQHPALKSVYGNIQPVIGGKLIIFIPLYRKVFELHRVFEIGLFEK